ncbi:MAG: PKD domain-containing protein [Methanomassiliicoccales archaeon]
MTIEHEDYYPYEHTDIIRFDNLTSKNLGKIQLDPLPTESHDLDVSVEESDTSDPVSGISWDLIDDDRDWLFDSGEDSGEINVTDLYPSNYTLVLSASGYEKEVRSFQMDENESLTVGMNDSKRVKGFVYMDDESPVESGLNAYMVSTDDTLHMEKRIIEPRKVGSNSFKFDAYEGEFFLVVDATGASSNVTSLNVTDNEDLDVVLSPESVQTEQYQSNFDNDDWNEFNMNFSAHRDHDQTIPVMDYSFLPSIRMQIDFSVGNGDGEVNATEVEEFINQTEEFGHQYVTTRDMLEINDTAFVSDGFVSYNISGLDGPVNSTEGFGLTYEVAYESIGSIDMGAPQYEGNMEVPVGSGSDTPVDRTYELVLPGGYELTENDTDTDVSVTGYTTVSVEPEHDAAPSTGEVEMTFEESEAPSASAEIESGEYSYPVMDGDELDYYIVRQGEEINFTASGSDDPNGNPLTYQWQFGDGEESNVSTVQTSHVYDEVSDGMQVNMTVIDVAGLEDQVSFTVKVDGVDPTPAIKVDDEVVPSGGSIEVDQNEALVFNGESAFDHIADEEPPAGIIVNWHWDFGDGNTTTVEKGENVTHTYEDAGTYDVTLNVTDSVGHYQNQTATIDVKDTEPPEVDFFVLNSDFVNINDESPIENETLYFNGTDTTDNNDTLDELDFFWEFGDGENATGLNVSHNYSSIETFTATLTVTDTSGNTANKTMQIEVTSSPRPDLRISSIELDPTTFTEGSSGKIMVNVTNVGNANASGISADFYKMTASGDEELIGTSTELTVDGAPANQLQPDESGIITFSWSPGSKGNYTVMAEAHADREINTDDNDDTVNVEVNEAAWKAAALYGGIFAVIVVVIVLLYMRKRLPWGASKAPAKGGRKRK